MPCGGFLGQPDRPAVPGAGRPGEPGDLCVLVLATADVLGELDADLVAAVVIDGRIV